MAYFELARLFAAANYISESLSYYGRYVSMVPGDAQAVVEFAKTLHRNRETGSALQILEQYMRTRPPNESVDICYGEILHNAGQLDKAEQTFIAALDLFPDTTQAAVGLSRLRRYSYHDDPVIQILRRSLEDVSTKVDSAPIHFALGKVFDDLVTSNENTARRILEFASLDWDPNCLKFHQVARDVKTASNWQVRQPIYTVALERWRNYEAHLTNFCRQLHKERVRYAI